MHSKLRQLTSRLSTSQGLTQAILTIVGNFGATGFSAIALILFSRILGPKDFGVFGVGFSIVLILARINDLGLNALLLKQNTPEKSLAENNRLLSYTIKVKLLFSLLILVVGVVGGPAIAKFLNFEAVWIIPLSFALSAFTMWYEVLLTVLQTMHRFTQAVIINALQAVTKLIVALAMLVFSFKDVTVTFIVYMAAPVVPLLMSRFLTKNQIKLNLKPAFKTEQTLAWNVARHTAIGFITAGLIENVDILFVQRYVSTYDAGLLAGVSRISMMILLVSYSLGNVLYPRVARYRTKPHLQAYLKKAWLIGVVALIGFLAFIPLSYWLILFTIGPEYISGNNVMLIQTAGSFLTLAAIPFLALFYVFKEDWYFSVSGVGQLAIVLLGNYLLVPEYGLLASAWTKFASKLFLCIFTVGLALILYHRKYAQETSHTT